MGTNHPSRPRSALHRLPDRFKEHFQLTITDYTNHLRLTCARRLLEATDLPVTEVALRSGFLNVSYFIRTFKNSYGISPLKYRKSAAD